MSSSLEATDALLNAVRDTICTTLGYKTEIECDVTPFGQPPPNAGGRFVALHGISVKNTMANKAGKQALDEYYSFKITVTIKTSASPYDRKRDGGIWALALPIRGLVHMSDAAMILATQYDTNGVTWVEPMIFSGGSEPQPKGPDWFWGEGQDPDPTGIAVELTFSNARRIQYIGTPGEPVED